MLTMNTGDSIECCAGHHDIHVTRYSMLECVRTTDTSHNLDSSSSINTATTTWTNSDCYSPLLLSL